MPNKILLMTIRLLVMDGSDWVSQPQLKRWFYVSQSIYIYDQVRALPHVIEKCIQIVHIHLKRSHGKKISGKGKEKLDSIFVTITNFKSALDKAWEGIH